MDAYVLKGHEKGAVCVARLLADAPSLRQA